MARDRTVIIESAKLRKAFKESAEGKSMVAVAAALFRHALTGGLRELLAKKRGEWEPLSARYTAWKRRKGHGTEAWEMTGATLRAISNNPPEKIGTKRRLRFGVNFYKSFAFVRPQAFKKSARGGWRELSNAAFQSKVLALLKYGSGAFRVQNWLDKKGTALGWTRADFKTKERVPARNLFTWEASWRPRMEADVARALAGELTGAGAESKAK